MAYYSDFENVFPPRSIPTQSGIFRCTGCGLQIEMQAGKHFPPYEHHEHSNEKRMLWKMVAAVQ
jgi:hypothetical protein